MRRGGKWAVGELSCESLLRERTASLLRGGKEGKGRMVILSCLLCFDQSDRSNDIS